MRGVLLIAPLLAVMAALPAMAQERGGIARRDPLATLDQINANRGCPLSATSVTVGVNKAAGFGALANQRLSTTGGGGAPGCQPLVSTQVVTGANLALGRGSVADQSITAQGPRGLLSTNLFTRGVNAGVGGLSTANQRLRNQVGR
jgi:hypothetical protein